MLTAILLAGAPRAALACPVCFGQSDSPMATAMNLGILVMLVVVAACSAALPSFFIYLIRRADWRRERSAEAATLADGAEPQEGTAQC